MRRALRWFFAVVCVGGFLVTAVLCVRSRFARPSHTFLKWGSPAPRFSATFQADRIGHTLYIVSRPLLAPAPTNGPTTAPATTQEMKFGRTYHKVELDWSFAGFFLSSARFDASSDRSRQLGRIIYVRIPNWFVLTSTALMTAWCIRGIVRDRRKRRHPTACKSCGYDLRAGHDKCPECGGESHVPVKSVVE